jgi:hypothetical protein
MKKSAFITLAILFVFGVSAQEIMARGFGGGGGGGGGYRSSGAAYRSPSMSRPANYQSRARTYSSAQRVSSDSTSPKQRVASRSATGAISDRASTGNFGRTGAQKPTQGQVQQFLNLPRGQVSQRGSDLAKIGTGAVAGALGAEGARRLLEGQRPGGPERPGLSDRRGEGGRPSTLPAHQVSNQIRDKWQNRHDKPFNPQWWRDHPNAARAYWDHNHHPWNYWWRTATWAALAGWTAGAAAGSAYGDPIYYDYGGNIYYEGDNVYVGGNQVATAQEYYQQASQMVTDAPDPASTPAEDWLPLGVFALGKDAAANSNMVLQLAVNKEGVIAGTYYNTLTDAGRPIKGIVDKKSQRAVWTFADGKNTDIIMETGIYNLTQDQTEALVHFGNDKTQRCLMVRLNEPKEEKQKDNEGESS